MAPWLTFFKEKSVIIFQPSPIRKANLKGVETNGGFTKKNTALFAK